MNYIAALIVGAGSGLSASLARAFAKAGMKVALAARSPDKLAGLAQETGARSLCLRRHARSRSKRYHCSRCENAPRPTSSSTTPATARAGRSSISIRPRWRRRSRSPPSAASWWRRRRRSACCRNGHGAIFFTGASASVKGYAQSAPFAMGKFALRGLAQSMARELSPQGIHVAHFVIDGGIRSARRPSRRTSRTRCSIPTPSRRAISHVLNQPRSAWTLGNRAAAVGGKVLAAV